MSTSYEVLGDKQLTPEAQETAYLLLEEMHRFWDDHGIWLFWGISCDVAATNQTENAKTIYDQQSAMRFDVTGFGFATIQDWPMESSAMTEYNRALVNTRLSLSDCACWYLSKPYNSALVRGLLAGVVSKQVNGIVTSFDSAYPNLPMLGSEFLEVFGRPWRETPEQREWSKHYLPLTEERDKALKIQKGMGTTCD